MENSLEKGKSMPVGTITNGFKKIAEGKWRKVSEHGMTKEEHGEKFKEANKIALDKNGGEGSKKIADNHYLNYEKLDSKEYSDVDVVGKESESSFDKFIQRSKKTVIDNHDNSAWKLDGDIKSATNLFAKQHKISESEVIDLQGRGILKFDQVQHKDGMYTNVKFNANKLAEFNPSGNTVSDKKKVDKSTINDIEKALVTLEIGYLTGQVSEEQIQKARKTAKNG